jgi:hypothetical protein
MSTYSCLSVLTATIRVHVRQYRGDNAERAERNVRLTIRQAQDAEQDDPLVGHVVARARSVIRRDREDRVARNGSRNEERLPPVGDKLLTYTAICNPDRSIGRVIARAQKNAAPIN